MRFFITIWLALFAVARGLQVETFQDYKRCDQCIISLQALNETLELEYLDEDRTNILSGGRLSSDGVRKGHWIAYETSEARLAHLTSQMCRITSTFTLDSPDGSKSLETALFLSNASRRAVFKPNVDDRVKTMDYAQTPEASEEKALRAFCDGLVEEYEDELNAVIVAKTVSHWETLVDLCVTRKRACSSEAYLQKRKDARAVAEAMQKSTAQKAGGSISGGDLPSGPSQGKKKKKHKRSSKKSDL